MVLHPHGGGRAVRGALPLPCRHQPRPVAGVDTARRSSQASRRPTSRCCSTATSRRKATRSSPSGRSRSAPTATCSRSLSTCGRRAVHVAGQGPSHRRAAALTRCPASSTAAAWSTDGSTVFYTVVDDAWRPHEVRRHRARHRPVRRHDGLRRARRAVLGRARLPAAAGSCWSARPRRPPRRFAPSTSDARGRATAGRRAAPGRGVRRRPRRLGGRDTFVIVHNHEAEDFAIALAALGDPDPAHWQTVLPHVRGTPGAGCCRAQGRGGAQRAGGTGCTASWCCRVENDSLGAPWEVEFDEPLFTADSGRTPTRAALRLGFSSFVTPATVYDSTSRNGSCCCASAHRCSAASTSDDYEQHREWATADDGTRVPISVVCRVGTPRDGSAPSLLYGYGSYEHSIDPASRCRGSRCSTAASSSRSRTSAAVASWAGTGTSRAAGTSEHVHRLRRLRRAPCRDRVGRTGSRSWRRGGSAGGLLVGRRANLAPERSPASSPRCRSSTPSPPSSTRRFRSPLWSGRSGATPSTTRRLRVHEVLHAVRERRTEGVPAGAGHHQPARHTGDVCRAGEMGCAAEGDRPRAARSCSRRRWTAGTAA